MDPPEEIPPGVSITHSVRSSQKKQADVGALHDDPSGKARGKGFGAHPVTIPESDDDNVSHLLPHYKEQAQRATPRPKPAAVPVPPAHPEQSISGLSVGSEDFDFRDQEEEEEASSLVGLPVAQAWRAEEDQRQRPSLSPSVLLVMRENQRARRRWIFGFALFLGILAIVLTMVIICRDGQCFKSKVPPVSSVPIQIVIAPGTCERLVLSFSAEYIFEQLVSNLTPSSRILL